MAIALPAIAGIAMTLVFLKSQTYPLISAESGLFVAIIGGVGAILGLGLIPSNRWWRAAVMGIVVALFFNQIIDWNVIGVRSRVSVPLLFLAGACLSALLGRNLHKILLAGIVIFAATTLFTASPELISSKRQPPAQKNAALVPIVHLILDEHVGLAGIPADIPGANDTRRRIERFYEDHRFRVWSHAFSRYSQTHNSVADILNFGKTERDRQHIELAFGNSIILKSAPYLKALHDFGYNLQVVQTDAIDYCRLPEVDSALCTTVRFKSLGWNKDSSLRVGDRLKVLLGVFANRSSMFRQSVIGYSKFRARLPKSVQTRMPALGLPPIMFTPISMVALFDRLIDVLETAGPGDLILSHAILPHFPLALTPDCKIRGGPESWRADDNLSTYGLYLEQLDCTYVLLDKLVAAIDSNPQLSEATVIIHGDHGARILGTQRDAHSTLFASRRSGREPVQQSDMKGIDILLGQEIFEPLGLSPETHADDLTIYEPVSTGGALRSQELQPF